MRLRCVLPPLVVALICIAPLRALPQRLAVCLSGGISARSAAHSLSPGKGVSGPERIEVTPARVALEGRRATRQFVVTGYFHGVPHDLTADAGYTVAMRGVVAMRGSRVTARGDGRTAITVSYAGRSQMIPVTVARTRAPDPVSFKFETRAVLTKQGCAGGSCHGSPHGKGGFSLSLFGYDPAIDRIALTRDGYNRRINVMDPAESLMIKKPLLEIPHVGGKRLHRSDTAYRLLTDWIYEGANTDLPATECRAILVTPATGRVLHAPFLRQQLSVLATFTDGGTRDVSAIATYDTSNAAVATVDADGLITAHGRGQAAISVRYLDKLQSVYITVVEDVPGFRWSDPPENSFVDQLVDAKLRQLQYLPSGTCTDPVFLRRVTLDLTGLLPTPEQTRRFLSDTAPDKRTRLIDTLLASEEYARFQALKKADLMRVSPDRLQDGRADRFAEWLTAAMRANMPYDRFARTLLTATGDTLQVPPSNYYLAIPTMEERTEMTAQIFMGTRIECTKCHNHPFENWTMRDYYSIAAVFARTRAEDGIVTLASTGEAQHPTTHQVMTPWGATADTKPAADRRAIFAAWLTQPGNPYFARVEVNRIWADLMGRGIVDPVDDFRSSNPPSNVPLLDALAQEFERSGYDRKHIIRLICTSRTYQRSCLPNPYNRTEETLFSHARIRLLTAEQVKDAIGMATKTLLPTAALPAREADMRAQEQRRIAALEPGYAAWVEARRREMACLPSWQAAGFAVLAACESRSSRHLLHEIYWDRDREIRDLRARMTALQSRMEYATQRPYPEGSEFTVTFGQPKRETACTCERQRSPTLLQALELLNGGTAYRAAEAGAQTYARLDNAALIAQLYLSALCRYPTAKEQATAQRYLTRAADRNIAVMDLIWTVINTQEFLFQH